jgi:hypothetical protein
MAGEEPEPPKYPGHTAAFGRIMDASGLAQAGNVVKAVDLGDLMQVRDDELVLLFRIGIDHTTVQYNDVARRTVAVEVYRRIIEALRSSRESIDRNTAALVEFKQESATASGRLETLTRWLIVFTIAVVLLTVVVAVHDLRGP